MTQRARLRLPGSGLQWFCLASFTLGAACLAFGLIIEGEPWVADHPFGVNVASGVTTALFGIPFAILIVQRLIQSNERKARRAAVQGAAEWAADQLVATTRRLVAFTDDPALVATINDLGTLARSIEACRQEWASRYEQPFREAVLIYGRTHGDLVPDEELSAALDRGASEARKLIAELDATRGHLRELIGDDFIRRQHLLAVAAARSFVDEQVKPRLIGADTPETAGELFSFLMNGLGDLRDGAAISRLTTAFDGARRELQAVVDTPARLVSATGHAWHAPFYYDHELDQVSEARAEVAAIRQLETQAAEGARRLRSYGASSGG